MEIEEDDIQDDDNSGYESDTLLFKFSSIKLEMWVECVADMKMSIVLDNRDHNSDNNGKNTLSIALPNSKVCILECLVCGHSGTSKNGAKFPSGTKCIYWKAHNIWTYLPFTVRECLLYILIFP